VSEASLERLRKFLLPLELAEAELKAKPAAAVMIILRDGPHGLEILLGERTKREGDPWSGQVAFRAGGIGPRTRRCSRPRSARRTRK